MSYTDDLGSARTLTIDYTNDSGVATNPSTVALTLTRPDGTTVSASGITNPSTGRYEYVHTWDQAGNWLETWTSTGIVLTIKRRWYIRRAGEVEIDR